MTEIRVWMDCEGCETNIKKALQKVKGVDEVDIDRRSQKVTVTGWADRKKILNTVRKTGKRAELWQFPYNPNVRNQSYTGQGNYCHDHSSAYTYYPPAPPPSSHYNYYEHGYDSHNIRSYYYHDNSTILGSRVADAFSDENPRGCSIM